MSCLFILAKTFQSQVIAFVLNKVEQILNTDRGQKLTELEEKMQPHCVNMNLCSCNYLSSISPGWNWSRLGFSEVDISFGPVTWFCESNHSVTLTSSPRARFQLPANFSTQFPLLKWLFFSVYVSPLSSTMTSIIFNILIFLDCFIFLWGKYVI